MMLIPKSAPNENRLAICVVPFALIVLLLLSPQPFCSFMYKPTLLAADGIGRALYQKSTTTDKQAERIKIAEGEYAFYEEGNGGAVGPFGEEVYDFHETWTLWRVARRGYKVEGERLFQSPKDVPHRNRFVAELSRDLTVIRVTEFADLKWKSGSGPLSCEFLPKELHCFSGDAQSGPKSELRLAMEQPFGFLWPISPFSLGGIARQTERDVGRDSPIQLVSVEQPSATFRVEPTVLDGQIRYVGEDDLKTAGQQWRAYRFSIKAPLHPQLLIWTSSKGLLLALATEHAHKDWPQEGMKLVRFKQWTDF